MSEKKITPVVTLSVKVMEQIAALPSNARPKNPPARYVDLSAQFYLLGKDSDGVVQDMAPLGKREFGCNTPGYRAETLIKAYLKFATKKLTPVGIFVHFDSMTINEWAKASCYALTGEYDKMLYVKRELDGNVEALYVDGLWETYNFGANLKDYTVPFEVKIA